VVALEERADASGFALVDLSSAERGGARGQGVVETALGSGVLLASVGGETSQGWVPVRAGRGPADTALWLRTANGAVRWQADVGPGLLAARFSAYDEERGTGLKGGGAQGDGQALSLTWAGQPTADAAGWRLQAWGRWSDFSQQSVAVAPGRTGTTPANDQDATPASGFGVNAALRRVSRGLSWEVGADARTADGETQERFRFMAGAFTRSRVAGGRNAVAGVYGEVTQVSGPWLFTGGARLDGWWNWNAHRVERDRATGAVTFEERPGDRDGVVPTARAGFRRTLGDGRYLRSAAYAGFRPPTLNELHRPFRVGNDVTESNPGLEPEKLYGAEAAVGGDGTDGGWSAGVFWNRLDDPVTNVTIGFGPGTFPRGGFIPAGGVLRQRQNAGRIDAVGFEAEGRQKVGPVELRAALSATDARVDGQDAAPQLTGKRPAQAPIWTATAGVRWTATDRLLLAAAARYESARFEDDLNTRRLGSATVVDARATWRALARADLYLAVDNLFDAAVATGRTADGVVSYDRPRTLSAGVTLRR
jgi:outer membrane receptor protein involved in Fe transport